MASSLGMQATAYCRAFMPSDNECLLLQAANYRIGSGPDSHHSPLAVVRGANFISACFLSHIGHSPYVIWLAALAEQPPDMATSLTQYL